MTKPIALSFVVTLLCMQAALADPRSVINRNVNDMNETTVNDPMTGGGVNPLARPAYAPAVGPTTGTTGAVSNRPPGVFRAWQAEYDAHHYARAEYMMLSTIRYLDEPDAGADQKYLSEALTDLIVTYYAEGKLADAKPVYQRSLKLVEEKKGKDSPDLGRAYQNYAALLKSLGENKEALAAQQKADAIIGLAFGTANSGRGGGSFPKGVATGVPTATAAGYESRPASSAGYTSAATIAGGDGSVGQLTDADFDDNVLRSDKPVLVDFYTDWCGPCKRMAPIVDELASQYAGRVKVFRVNTDQNRGLAQRYQINAIPRFMTFKNGSARESFTGGMPKENLAGAVENLLK